MILMHGLFDLNEGVEEGAFRESFELFSKHLNTIEMVVSWRCMRHQEHDGFNSNQPDTRYYVSMEFLDMGQAQQCWDRIEDDSEPLHSLHTDVFSKIQNYRFFLASDI